MSIIETKLKLEHNIISVTLINTSYEWHSRPFGAGEGGGEWRGGDIPGSGA